nr:MAG TPA: hypothetical protein [Caudoviricetes sp.]DAY43319.1 MAG TPA: hypothetical protein [Caudoviricetes sp.]
MVILLLIQKSYNTLGVPLYSFRQGKRITIGVVLFTFLF